MTTSRITFNSTNLDFAIKRDTLDIQYRQDRNDNKSGSGKIETVNLYGYVEISFRAMFTLDQYRQAFAFFSWARQGKVFSLAADNTLTANTTLDGAAAAAQKVIPVTATTGFAAGNYCLIRATDEDDEYESVLIASVSAGVSVTATNNLIFSYTTGDLFRHWHYWAEAVLLSTTFNPKDMSNVRALYEADFKVCEKL